jgi:excisionase family DNA binding protein
VDIAKVDALISELEADREDLLSGPANEAHASPLAPANDLSAEISYQPHPSAPVAAPAPEPDRPVTAPEYLTTVEAAALLGVTVKGLEALRARGEGPPFIRVGRAVRYRRDDLRPAK